MVVSGGLETKNLVTSLLVVGSSDPRLVVVISALAEVYAGQSSKICCLDSTKPSLWHKG